MCGARYIQATKPTIIQIWYMELLLGYTIIFLEFLMVYIIPNMFGLKTPRLLVQLSLKARGSIPLLVHFKYIII
jgi:hypothetical protein